VTVVPTVLIVEDNPLNMKMFAVLLEAGGYTVLQAADGLAGLDLARRVRPQLIIMDLDLPGISGLVATRTLKSDPQTSNIPILLTTATEVAADNREVGECGCDGFMPKPISVASFLETVAAFLRHDPATA
jgi:two-component system cell cycle response regulator DivK